jgi:hypothetical protein
MDGRLLELVVWFMESNVFEAKTGADGVELGMGAMLVELHDIGPVANELESKTGAGVGGDLVTGVNVLEWKTEADVVGDLVTGVNVLEWKTEADVVGDLVTGANLLESKTGADVDGDLVTGNNVLESVCYQISKSKLQCIRYRISDSQNNIGSPVLDLLSFFSFIVLRDIAYT